MGKLYLMSMALLFFAGSVMGQGTFEFAWHGDSNYFQASFDVTAAEMQPGAVFNSPLFLSSMSVTNPLGQTYHGGDSSSAGSGSYIPWGLDFQLNNFSRNTELVIIGGGLSGSDHRTAGLMWEQPMSSSDFLWYERGYWSVAQIPEPSTAALLSTAGIICLWRRRHR